MDFSLSLSEIGLAAQLLDVLNVRVATHLPEIHPWRFKSLTGPQLRYFFFHLMDRLQVDINLVGVPILTYQ